MCFLLSGGELGWSVSCSWVELPFSGLYFHTCCKSIQTVYLSTSCGFCSLPICHIHSDGDLAHSVLSWLPCVSAFNPRLKPEACYLFLRKSPCVHWRSQELTAGLKPLSLSQSSGFIDCTATRQPAHSPWIPNCSHRMSTCSPILLP